MMNHVPAFARDTWLYCKCIIIPLIF